MNLSLAHLLHWKPNSLTQLKATIGEANRAGGSVQWVVVKETAGFLPAQITADSLNSEGVPARAWQESIGQSYGMTVGRLGTGYVLVPEEFAAQAKQLLEDAESYFALTQKDDLENEWEYDEP